MNNKMQLSHVLYRVQDLHQAVRKLQDTGFVVEYGTHPDKAYNALIWFEQGVFIEIYNNAQLPKLMQCLLKILGFQAALDRMNKWQQVANGWCEWSLETTANDLKELKDFFKQRNIPFKFKKSKRKDINRQILRWELLMPNDIMFPFLMSAYTPNPRPKNIQHPNGIKCVSTIIVGKEKLDTHLLETLFSENTQVKIIEEKEGLQEVEFENSDLRITSILK